jgi:hypothetical protein
MRQQNQVVDTVADFVVFGKLNSRQSTSLFDMNVDPRVHEKNPDLLNSAILASHHQWREPLIVCGVWVTVALCKDTCCDFGISNNMQEGIALCINMCIDLERFTIALSSLSSRQRSPYHGFVFRVIVGPTQGKKWRLSMFIALLPREDMADPIEERGRVEEVVCNSAAVHI